MVIQRNLAAWIALYRSSKTHGESYWTLNGLAVGVSEVSKEGLRGWSARSASYNYNDGTELLFGQVT